MNSFASQAELTGGNQASNQQGNQTNSYNDKYDEKPEKVKKPLSSKQVLHRNTQLPLSSYLHRNNSENNFSHLKQLLSSLILMLRQLIVTVITNASVQIKII